VDVLGADLIWLAQIWLGRMTWLVVPLVGIVLTAPAWVWLLWSLRHKHRKAPAE
jgi:hypothetical protein